MPDHQSKSLISFFQTRVLPHLSKVNPKILEVGSGVISLFESLDNNLNIISIDKALPIPIKKEKNITYVQENILTLKKELNSFDLVFDSHCLHCLNSKSDLFLALGIIFQALKDDGIFTTEIMIQPTHEKVSFPCRLILESIEIENLIIQAGFKIIYLVVVPQMKFYTEIASEEIECDMLRIIAKKERAQ